MSSSIHPFRVCNIVYINLSDCKYCDNLPPLGQLPSLRCLEIGNFDGLVRVGPEFYGDNSRSSFVSVEILKFKEMPKWEEWSIPFDGVETFPKVKVLSIRSCEKLIGDLPCLLPSLKQLEIIGCSDLASSLPMMPEVNWLKLLWLIGCENLEIPLLQSYDFPNLTQLGIFLCKILITSSSSGIMSWDPQRHPDLTTFEISACNSLESFPEEGLLPTTITKLVIHELGKLKTLDSKGLQQLTSLKSLQFSYCTELQSISEDGLPLSLEKMHISFCPLLNAKCEKRKGSIVTRFLTSPKLLYINGEFITS